MRGGPKVRAPLVGAAAGGALIAGLLWVWPFASVRDARSADVEAAEQIAESLDSRLAALREAAAAADHAEADQHRRFSEALDEHLVSVLDGAALAAWAQNPESDTEAPLAFLNVAEALWRSETQVAMSLLAGFEAGVAEVAVSDSQPVEGLAGLVMSSVTFRVEVGSLLEDVIALALGLDTRPDVILDEVKAHVDDGPEGTGLWSADLALRWYRLPDTLEPR